MQFYQCPGLFATLIDKVQLTRHFIRTPAYILFRRVKKITYPPRRIVKIRYGLIQPFTRKIYQIALKFPKGIGDRIGHFIALQHIVTAGILNKYIRPPAIAVIIKYIRHIGICPQQTQCPTVKKAVVLAIFTA